VRRAARSRRDETRFSDLSRTGRTPRVPTRNQCLGFVQRRIEADSTAVWIDDIE
jgi:hypothetical protein